MCGILFEIQHKLMKERIKQWIRYEQWKRFFERYERVFVPGALVLGVVVDFVTFRSISIASTFYILGGHVCLAVLSIILLNGKETKRGKIVSYARLIAPLVLQFSFGALLSASFIFYWFSGSFSVSWPLLGIVVVLMTSNEVLRHYYQRPVIQFSVFYFILFSLGTLVFPFLFNSIDVSLFVLSGVGSLVLVFLFILILSRWFENIRRLRIPISISILFVFTLMNFLYFLNVIPPIPLSLSEAGVYHYVERTETGYLVQTEEETWMDRLLPGQSIHVVKGKGVYVFTSIFSPIKLTTTIYHRWQYFDQTKNTWVDKDRLSFSLTSGRQEGYRGYSMKTVVPAGKWRVNVETKNGQVLGRIRFEVISVANSPDLILEVH